VTTREYLATLQSTGETIRITEEIELDGFLINNHVMMGSFTPTPGLPNMEDCRLTHYDGGGYAGHLVAIEVSG
jgi:hypothetical protein